MNEVTIFKTSLEAIYFVSQVITIVIAGAVFWVSLIQGDSESQEGNQHITYVGSGLWTAILLAAAVCVPIFGFDERASEQWHRSYPDAQFANIYLIIYVIDLFATFGLLARIKLWDLRYLLLPLLSLIIAAWVTKTVLVMIDVAHDRSIGWFGTTFYELVLTVYVLAYFAAPYFFFVRWLQRGQINTHSP